MANTSSLAAVVDGKALPEGEARELWTRFSQYMDEHEADLKGFATLNGWVSVTPEFRRGQAVLIVVASQKTRAKKA